MAYQARKRAKTSNMPITDSNGYVVATTDKAMKHMGLVIAGALFNADSGFDTKKARKVCFNHQVVPNMAENKSNRKAVKRGRKRLFSAVVYRSRFVSERSFACIDKFRALLVRFDRKHANFLAGHHLAFALINLRHLFAMKV